MKPRRVTALFFQIGFVTSLYLFVQGRALADSADTAEASIRVRLEVTAAPTTKRLVTDCFRQQLQVLHTIKLVETEPDYVWSILAVKPKTTGGYQTGCVLSVVILRRCLQKAAGERQHREIKPAEQAGEEDVYDAYQHFLRIGPSGGLEVLCEEIVDDFQKQWLATPQ